MTVLACHSVLVGAPLCSPLSYGTPAHSASKCSSSAVVTASIPGSRRLEAGTGRGCDACNVTTQKAHRRHLPLSRQNSSCGRRRKHSPLRKPQAPLSPPGDPFFDTTVFATPELVDTPIAAGIRDARTGGYTDDSAGMHPSSPTSTGGALVDQLGSTDGGSGYTSVSSSLQPQFRTRKGREQVVLAGCHRLKDRGMCALSPCDGSEASESGSSDTGAHHSIWNGLLELFTL